MSRCCGHGFCKIIWARERVTLQTKMAAKRLHDLSSILAILIGWKSLNIRKENYFAKPKETQFFFQTFTAYKKTLLVLTRKLIGWIDLPLWLPLGVLRLKYLWKAKNKFDRRKGIVDSDRRHCVSIWSRFLSKMVSTAVFVENILKQNSDWFSSQIQDIFCGNVGFE